MFLSMKAFGVCSTYPAFGLFTKSPKDVRRNHPCDPRKSAMCSYALHHAGLLLALLSRALTQIEVRMFGTVWLKGSEGSRC